MTAAYPAQAMALNLAEAQSMIDAAGANRVQLICSQIGGVPPQLAHRWSVERLQRTFLRLVADGQVDVKSLVTDKCVISFDRRPRIPPVALGIPQ